MTNYSIHDHIHLYSSWAAARASSVKNNRFKVEIGQKILNESRIRELVLNPELLPSSQKQFDLTHREWRNEIIDLGFNQDLYLTHGISAKLINIYLKSIIICGGYHEHPKAKFVHPPIDRVLLKELYRVDFNKKKKLWKKYEIIAWSKFNSEEYEDVIREIIFGLDGSPLWKIEKYWQGHQ